MSHHFNFWSLTTLEPDQLAFYKKCSNYNGIHQMGTFRTSLSYHNVEQFRAGMPWLYAKYDIESLNIPYPKKFIGIYQKKPFACFVNTTCPGTMPNSSLSDQVHVYVNKPLTLVFFFLFLYTLGLQLCSLYVTMQSRREWLYVQHFMQYSGTSV